MERKCLTFMCSMNPVTIRSTVSCVKCVFSGCLKNEYERNEMLTVSRKYLLAYAWLPFCHRISLKTRIVFSVFWFRKRELFIIVAETTPIADGKQAVLTVRDNKKMNCFCLVLLVVLCRVASTMWDFSAPLFHHG